MCLPWASVYRGRHVSRLSRPRDSTRGTGTPLGAWGSPLTSHSAALKGRIVSVAPRLKRLIVLADVTSSDRPFWERRSKPIMGISSDMDRRRSDRCIPNEICHRCSHRAIFLCVRQVPWSKRMNRKWLTSSSPLKSSRYVSASWNQGASSPRRY